MAHAKLPAKSRRNRIGVRPALTRAFLDALEADFGEHGHDAIMKVRDEEPRDYLRIILALLPEELVSDQTIEEMTDEELAAALDALRPIVTAKLAAARREGGAAKSE